MMISGLLLAILMVIAVWIIAFYGFSSHNLLILLGLVVAPIGIFLLNNPAVWFVAILGIQQSGLIIPGLPQGLELVHVLMAGFIGVTMARLIIGDFQRIKSTMATKCLYIFIFVVVITIAFRGVGLRALGSSLWGGMAYIRLLIAACFMLASRFVTLSIRQWKIAIMLMLGFSFLPSLAQVLYMVSGGQLYHQYMFIRVDVMSVLKATEAMAGGGVAVRFHLFKNIASNLMLALIVLVPFRGSRRVIIVLGVVVALVLAGLSGFRSALLSIAGTLFLYVVIADKKARVKHVIEFFLVALLGLVLMIPLARYMPSSIQRAVSWIPQANVDAYVRQQAMATIDWRIEVWKMAWRDVPDYLVLGKGVAIDPAIATYYSARTDSILGAYLTHNYHSGPLSLLLDLGLMGFIAGSLFFLFSSLEAWRKLKSLGEDAFIDRFYKYLLAVYLYRIATFYLIYGDISKSYVESLMIFAILWGVANTSQMERQKAALKKVEQEKPKYVSSLPRINPFDQAGL